MSDFSGGCVPDTERVVLGANQLRWAENYYIDYRDNTLRSRRGTAKHNSAAMTSAIGGYSLVRYYSPTAGQTIAAVQTNNYAKVYTDSGTTTAWTEITGGSNLTSGYRVRMLQNGSDLFIFNSNVMQYWQGSGTTKSDCVYDAAGYDSTVIQPKLAAVNDNRLWVVNSAAAYRNKVFFSIIDIYATSPGTDILFQTGDEITLPYTRRSKTGITALWNDGFNGDILVFRLNDIFRVTGTSAVDYSLFPVDNSVGCCNQEAICLTDNNLLVFIGNKNVYAYDGKGVITIGDNIASRMKYAYLDSACCTYIPRIKSVLCSWPGESWLWNTETGGWTPWTAHEVYCSEVFDGDYADDRKVVFMKDNSAYLFQMDTGFDDSAATYDVKLMTGDLHMGKPDVHKSFKKIYLHHNGISPVFTAAMTCNGSKRLSTGQTSVQADHVIENKWADLVTTHINERKKWVQTNNDTAPFGPSTLKWERDYLQLSEVEIPNYMQGTNAMVKLDTTMTKTVATTVSAHRDLCLAAIEIEYDELQRK